jgi:hypothetical protein
LKGNLKLFELLQQTMIGRRFCFVCWQKNFGLNTNGEIFKATSIPFSIIRKESFEDRKFKPTLWQAGLLDVEKEDNYFKDFKIKYYYLLHKYQIEKSSVNPVQFFKTP